MVSQPEEDELTKRMESYAARQNQVSSWMYSSWNNP